MSSLSAGFLEGFMDKRSERLDSEKAKAMETAEQIKALQVAGAEEQAKRYDAIDGKMQQIRKSVAAGNAKEAYGKAVEADMGGVSAKQMKEIYGGDWSSIDLTPQAKETLLASLTSTLDQWDGVSRPSVEDALSMTFQSNKRKVDGVGDLLKRAVLGIGDEAVTYTPTNFKGAMDAYSGEMPYFDGSALKMEKDSGNAKFEHFNIKNGGVTTRYAVNTDDKGKQTIMSALTFDTDESSTAGESGKFKAVTADQKKQTEGVRSALLPSWKLRSEMAEVVEMYEMHSGAEPRDKMGYVEGQTLSIGEAFEQNLFQEIKHAAKESGEELSDGEVIKGVMNTISMMGEAGEFKKHTITKDIPWWFDSSVEVITPSTKVQMTDGITVWDVPRAQAWLYSQEDGPNLSVVPRTK